MALKTFKPTTPGERQLVLVNPEAAQVSVGAKLFGQNLAVKRKLCAAIQTPGVIRP